MSETILVGHSNMDIDCFGSIAMAKYLYPNAQLVRSGRIHPVARNLHTIYREHLSFIQPKELKNRDIGEIVVLDTRQHSRIKEYLQFIPEFNGKFTVYDHHSSQDCDLPAAELHSVEMGSNSGMLALELEKQDISVSEIDATIALAGIYADTGNFTHNSVSEKDFRAASYLLRHGASPSIVQKLLSKLKDDHQVSLFHQILNEISFTEIHGFSMCTSFMKLSGQMAGLAAVVEQVFEVEDADAYLAVFELEKERSHLIICRARNNRIDLNMIMNSFGGAGHPQAASALLKNSAGLPVMSLLHTVMEQQLNHALTSEELMRPATTIPAEWSLMEASIHLEETNNSGAPVIDDEMKLAGMITLRDIQKGRRADQMHAPVKAYMTKKVISTDKKASVREIERLFYRNDIGHLPVLENETVIGIVTRSDYLTFLQNNSKLAGLVLQPDA